MIDVHYAVSPHVSEKQVDLFLRSMENQPVTLHQMDFIPNDVGRLRFLGYQVGNQPYCAKVDADDLVEPGAFDILLEMIYKYSDAGISAVYSNHYCHNMSSSKRFKRKLWYNPDREIRSIHKLAGTMHHIVVYKKSAIKDAIPLIQGHLNYRWLLNAAAICEGKVVQVNRPLYHWHITDEGSHNTREGRVTGKLERRLDWALKSLNKTCNKSVNQVLIKEI